MTRIALGVMYSVHPCTTKVSRNPPPFFLLPPNSVLVHSLAAFHPNWSHFQNAVARGPLPLALPNSTLLASQVISWAPSALAPNVTTSSSPLAPAAPRPAPDTASLVCRPPICITRKVHTCKVLNRLFRSVVGYQAKDWWYTQDPIAYS